MKEGGLVRSVVALVAVAVLVAGCDWGDLDGIPPGFADGVDNDTAYTAGPGLTATSGELSVDLAGTGTAETVARSDHDHDADYVLKAGDTMAGDLVVNADITANRLVYSSARTHYISLCSEHFQPRLDGAYVNGDGNGGAYLVSGGGGLVAPVSLPHGAVVTSLVVYFDDTSANDMDVYLISQSLAAGGYTFLASASSDSDTGYYSRSTTLAHTVNNQTLGYHVLAYSSNWDSTLKIKGAVITYTISEAP